MRDLKGACVSFVSQVGNVNQNLDKILVLSAAAKKEGADLVLFGELSLTGYTSLHPKNIAMERTHKALETIFQFARKQELVICCGFAEKCDGHVYITSLITDGITRHFYRKIHLGYEEQKVFSAGDEIAVYQTRDALFGLSICIEAHMAPLFQIYRSQGAEIMLLPYAAGMRGDICRKNWMKILPARASDMGVYVLACNLLKEASGGGMCILDPKGNVLAEYYGSEEHILLCDLKGELPRNHPDGNMREISYFDRQRPEIYEKYNIFRR